MTTLIQALREKYPMYADPSDEVLIEGYRKKFHPNQDREELEELWRDKGEQAKQDEFGNVGTFLRGARIGFEQTKDLIFDGGIRGLINYASGNKEQAAKDFERYQKEKLAMRLLFFASCSCSGKGWIVLSITLSIILTISGMSSDNWYASKKFLLFLSFFTYLTKLKLPSKQAPAGGSGCSPHGFVASIVSQ